MCFYYDLYHKERTMPLNELFTQHLLYQGIIMCPSCKLTKPLSQFIDTTSFVRNVICNECNHQYQQDRIILPKRLITREANETKKKERFKPQDSCSCSSSIKMEGCSTEKKNRWLVCSSFSSPPIVYYGVKC